MIDAIDQKILVLIQKNAGLPLSEISKRVGISPTPCWNRIKKMEERGVISARTIVLNRKAINLPVLVFLSIQVAHHSGDWISELQNVVDKYDQIIEAHRLTGSDADYLLKVVASSIRGKNREGINWRIGVDKNVFKYFSARNESLSCFAIKSMCG